MEHYALPAVLVLLLLAFISIYLGRRKLQQKWGNLKTRKSLDQLGLKQISNVHYPDGLGHYFTIDRLILRHDGITLLMYKPFPGKIYCAENIDHWTQMLGTKSYRFKNPLYELDNQIKAVSAYIPGVPVNGFLFFDSQAEFPKGHPERIIHLKNIPDELKRDKKQEAKAPVLSAWKKLLTMLKAGKKLS